MYQRSAVQNDHADNARSYSPFVTTLRTQHMIDDGRHSATFAGNVPTDTLAAQSAPTHFSPSTYSPQRCTPHHTTSAMDATPNLMTGPHVLSVQYGYMDTTVVHTALAVNDPLTLHMITDQAPSLVAKSYVLTECVAQRKDTKFQGEEIEKMYKCDWKGCEKAYKTLNHLNGHVMMQTHGFKRTSRDFKEARYRWKVKKKETQRQRRQGSL